MLRHALKRKWKAININYDRGKKTRYSNAPVDVESIASQKQTPQVIWI